MRCVKLAFAVALTIVSAMLVAAPHPTAATADEVADAEKIYPISHRFDELPVWTQDGKTAKNSDAPKSPRTLRNPLFPIASMQSRSTCM